MSVVAQEIGCWSARRWSLIVLVLFTGHITAVLLLSKKPVAPYLAERVAIRRVHFVSEQSIEPGIAEILALKDPTLFALSHPNGFSRAAWLTLSPVRYTMTNVIEFPQALTMNAASLGEDFARYVKDYVMRPPEIAERELPRVLPLTSSSQRADIQATLQIRGDLARWSLVSQRPLPDLQPDQVVSNCVVRVVINASGATTSAVVWPPTGFEALDRKAEEFAKAARFVAPDRKSSSSSGLTVGQLIFQWSIAEAPIASETTASEP
jgi:TonB family protein